MPAPAPKKKKPLEQIIEERKQQQLAEKQRKLQLQKERELQENEDPLERKRRLEQAVLESDLAGGVSITAATAPPATNTADGLDRKTAPANKAEWEKYASQMAKKVNSFGAKPTMQLAFCEKLFHELAQPLDYTDIRKLSSMLSTLSNEKQRAEKDKKSGKSSKNKAQVKVMANDIPETFDDYGDDYDDFM